jgi:hypothetical protein
MLGNLKKVLGYFLIGTTLLNLSVPSAKADPKDECTNAVYSVAQEIRSFGTSVSMGGSGDANEYHTGNPTNRNGVLAISIGGTISSGEKDVVALVSNSPKSDDVAVNIMSSGQLQQKWADYLVKNCSNLAVVSYGQAHTDWINDFAIQSDGTTRPRSCIEPGGNIITTWNTQICL